jgi:cyclophilin family peptidyl-prolyl cis-trans isomerase
VQQARKQVNHQQRRQRLMAVVGGLLAVALILGLFALLFNGNSSSDAPTTTAPGETTTTAAGGAAASLPAPPPGITLTEATPCPPAAGSQKRVQKFAGPPPSCLDDGAAYTATFSTTKGDFTATLDTATAPVASNNFVVLARYHFYDGTPFHRIVPGFVIQGGDGDGEPWGNNDLGYQFGDELPSGPEAYTDHSLAMANAGPGTNGSQFFVVLPGGGIQLNPANYTRFGEVIEGQEVVDAIGELGNQNQEPTEVVLINSVTITESPA